ncbi:helix-turn-helix domain-containing protein [Paraburkholderia sp. DHOC27]|uniref:helix-turn-helix domain-containing protein n=1 Tax=Paraburkholderia sp. DHOC27 TaxID=2303330 RepID=UPI000E3D6440|nr:helix-turn-helix transcriptional regulator [Paraburkholderia sp. DHOC27]RFU49423.1 XRE family transcriptional regulator [Paraburkholderia sp. DHOC27]
MSKSANPSTLPANDVGEMLRHWRSNRGKSQLDLALDTGVSQRHISFVEVGRSVPSRQMLIDLAQGLDIPLRDRNTLLLAAGYAPVYSEGAWNSQEMQSITRALERILHQHEPFPALVMDRYWNVLMTNDAAPRFFNCFIDMAQRTGTRNMLHLIFDPAGMRPFVANWAEVAKSLVQRVYREAVGRVVDEPTRELLDALLAYPDVKPEWRIPDPPDGTPEASAMPVVPLGFFKDGNTLNYFSMVSTVGTPRTVAAQELRVECLFPADEATERLHLDLMNEVHRRD